MAEPAFALPLAEALPDPVELTFLGRSTVLLGLDGTRLLTDPSLPSGRRLPWQRRAPRPEPPTVDAVLISHAHARHMDVATLRRLPGEPRIIVPAGSGGALVRAGLERVEEVRAGDVVRVGTVAVQAVWAHHGALHAALPAASDSLGYLIDGTSRVYFAGDSVPFDEMARLADVDLALLPVAPVLRYVGPLSPTAAAEIAAIVRPRVVVPIHWGSLGQFEEPAPPWQPSREQFTADRLEAALLRAFEERGATAELQVVEPGYSTVVSPRAALSGAPVTDGVPISPDRRAVGLPATQSLPRQIPGS